MQNDLKQELGVNFIEYAVAVNTDRAIPDAKSGLKPVAKRILWSAFEEGRTFSKPHVKAARIVGDVMGKYHPHGDTSIYGAMVRLSQSWTLRYPLIDWHGANGNQLGDGPAAMRYTEARLSKLSEDGMLAGIKKKNVEFIPNFDETLDEPVTLPAIFPNLLCNPNTGIGVAMACNWLPHNLNEVAQAIYDYMDGKAPMLPGPDFPTGGIVINSKDVPSIMRTGHGSVKVRGRYNTDKNCIIFYEIPYGTTVETLLKEIGDVCDKKEIEGISDIRDESNKKGLRIVIECSKGTNLDSIAAKLYAKTNLQTSISYNQVALIDKTPVEMNLTDCCKVYVEHNIDCIVKEAKFDLEKAMDRLHIVDGLLKALEDIDNIIALIKKSASAAAAKEALIAKYAFTEVQAKAILAMRLSSLANLEKVELQNEKAELIENINKLNALINEVDLQQAELKNRLSTIVKKYGDKRKTELVHIELKPEEKEIAEVVPEDTIVIMSKNGEIKRIAPTAIKTQRKNGKGVKNSGEVTLDMIRTNTIDTLMFFTSKGKMYRTIVDNIPVGTVASRGVGVGTLINMEMDEEVIAVTSLNRKSDAKFVVFFTKQGLIKKTSLEEYLKVKRSTGIQAIKLNENDSIANVYFLNDEDVLVITKNGMSIHFDTVSISPIGRVTAGVKTIKLAEDDEVVVGLPIYNKTDEVAIFTENGFAKKTPIEEFPPQGRAGKGVLCYKPTATTGKIAGATLVSKDDNILIAGKTNSICISTSDIPSLTRTSTGNMVTKTPIVSIVKV